MEGPRGRCRGQTRLEASFNLSLDALRRDDEAAWRAFAWLGVLPEDVSIAAPMAATLWEMSQAEAAGLLEFLWNDALLLPAAPFGSTSKRGRHIGRTTCCTIWRGGCSQHRHRSVLDMTMPQVHATLLERYLAKTQNGLWYTLSSDGYIHARLTWHMQRAEWIQQLHDFLNEETPSRTNGWFHVRDQLGQTGGYLQDVARAWSLAVEQFEVSGDPICLGRQCRYALISTSVRSLAKNIPPRLLSALVERRHLTPAQGLTYARLVPDLTHRVEALAAVAPFLPDPLKIDAMCEALTGARQAGNDQWRLNMFVDILSALPPDLLAEAQNTAGSFEDASYRANALSLLLPLACEHRPHTLKATLQAFEEAAGQRGAVFLVGDTSIRAGAVRSLAQWVPTGALPSLMGIVSQIDAEADRAACLVELIPRLAAAEQEQALLDAFAIARHLPEGSFGIACPRAKVLRVLARYLPEDMQQQALREALSAAVAVAARSSEFWFPLGDSDPVGNPRPLADLAQDLPQPMILQAWEELEAIPTPQNRAQALAALAPFVPPEQRDAILQDIRAAADSVSAQWRRTSLQKDLAPRFAQLGMPQDGLAAALDIADERTRAEALASLGPYLTDTLLDQALAAARRIQGWPHLVKALIGLVPSASKQSQSELLSDIVLAVRNVDDEYERTRLIVEIAPEIARIGHAELALVAVKEIAPELSRADALAAIVPHLPATLLPEAMQVAREIRDEETRTDLLVEFAALVPDDRLDDLLSMIGGLRSGAAQARFLVRLGGLIPQRLGGQVLTRVLCFGLSVQV